MENKSNIYKSKPEFVKEGFDPFSVQVLKDVRPQSIPATSLFWRLTPNDETYFMVDQLGRCVYGLRDGYPTGLCKSENSCTWQNYGEADNLEWPDYVGPNQNWGFVQIDAEFTNDIMRMTIGGVDYEFDDSYGLITPQLQEFQEVEPVPLTPGLDVERGTN